MEINYVHADHLGTPVRITRSTDNARRWQWNKDPFGTLVANENPESLGAFVYSLRFPGQVFDGQAGLHQNMLRDYSPAIGRYIESDSIGLLGGVNTYGYALQNPALLADPTGEFVVPAAVKIVEAIVNTVGAVVAIREANEIKERIMEEERRSYHRICDERAPPGLKGVICSSGVSKRLSRVSMLVQTTCANGMTAIEVTMIRFDRSSESLRISKVGLGKSAVGNSPEYRSAQLKALLEEINSTLGDFEERPAIAANDASSSGDRPLHKVALWGDVDAAQVLLENGADVNALGEDGDTPLHRAIAGRSLPMIVFLLANEARSGIANRYGVTAKQEAESTEDNLMIGAFQVRDV